MSGRRTGQRLVVERRDPGELFGQRLTLKGRMAFYAERLIEAGPKGFSTIELPAGLRVSDGIFKLRKVGVDIASDREEHAGEFAGSHARYRLVTPLVVVVDEGAAERRAA